MERDPESDDDLATTLPPSLTVELPDEVHETPDDEAIVVLDEVAISPIPEADALATTSIEVDTTAIVVADPSDPLASGADDQETGPAGLESHVVPLPVEEPTPAPALASRSRKAAGSRRSVDQDTGLRTEPEGFWQHLIYRVTFGWVDIGDSTEVRLRKEIDARIDVELKGGTRFIPVLSRKGGVGKTTITTLLGMALADVRRDRVLAIDGNPDRGTLAERVNKQTRSTVRDLVLHAPEIREFGDLATHVSRDLTRLDVLASDTDPLLSEAFDANDYNVVADVVARHYSIVLTDCGTGVVHSVMRAILQRADAVVVVSGGSVDEARLASETLTWLEANNYGDLVHNAVVALNTSTQGTNLVKLGEIEAHFRSRVRDVVRIPYDAELAAGSVVRFGMLKPFTRESARDLAALVMDGLPPERRV